MGFLAPFDPGSPGSGACRDDDRVGPGFLDRLSRGVGAEPDVYSLAFHFPREVCDNSSELGASGQLLCQKHLAAQPR